MHSRQGSQLFYLSKNPPSAKLKERHLFFNMSIPHKVTILDIISLRHTFDCISINTHHINQYASLLEKAPRSIYLYVHSISNDSSNPDMRT